RGPGRRAGRILRSGGGLPRRGAPTPGDAFVVTAPSDRGRFFPVSRTIAEGDADPIDLFRRLRTSGQECFLLESVEGGEAMARYLFLGGAATEVVTVCVRVEGE